MRTIINRLLRAGCIILALLICLCPSVMGASDGSWRGYRIVTVVNSGARNCNGLPVDVAQVPAVGKDVLGAPAAGDGVIRVAVIDSGISAESGLAVAAGRNYLTDESYLVDQSGHGTAVASIVAAAAPEAELISLKIEAKGALTTARAAAAAIRGAVDDFSCDILIMAFGQSDSNSLRQAVEYAAGKGVVLIAAVGNEGQTYRRGKVYYPAGYGQVIGIGATDARGQVASFSQRGGVSFVSCGEQLSALTVDGQERMVTGTSFSAAAVAGLAARLRIETAASFWSYLQSVAADRGAVGYDLDYGFGFLNLRLEEEATCKED